MSLGATGLESPVPDLSDKIVRSSDKYCKRGVFADVYKRQLSNGGEIKEVCIPFFNPVVALHPELI